MQLMFRTFEFGAGNVLKNRFVLVCGAEKDGKRCDLQRLCCSFECMEIEVEVMGIIHSLKIWGALCLQIRKMKQLAVFV